jgi:hypothetical protein
MKKTVMSFITACCVLQGQVQSQQVVACAGGAGQNSNTILEWTLGEPVIVTLTSGDIMLTQGFQQPELTVTAILTKEELPFTVEAFPNPTGDLLMIRIEHVELQDFQYVLYDVNGKVLDKKALEGTVTGIVMNYHPSGVYLLRINQSGKEIKMFEIVKN